MLFWITVALLVLHLLCVNLASAGPLLCMYYERSEAKGNLAAGRAGRNLAMASFLALVLGIATGLLIGVLRWNPELQDVLQRLSRKVHFGGIEIIFSLALMGWHWAWWRSAKSRWRAARYVVLLLASTNLLYHFPTLFAVVAHLREVGGDASDAITPSEFRQLLALPDVLSQALHVTLASVATAGAWVILRATRCTNADDRATARPAAAVALVATVLQLPVGLWLTTAFPKAAQKQLMGQDPIATICFLGSIIGALSLMHHLAAVALRKESGRSGTVSVVLLVAIVAAMTVAMTLSRT